MNKKRKMIMLITLIVIIVFIISIILPIRKENEIVYEHDWDDGGRSAVCYYNIYGVKIKTIVKQVKNMKVKNQESLSKVVIN